MSEDAGRTEKYHDIDDVEEAVEDLSVADHQRLRKIASFRSGILGSHPTPSASEDLLQEALVRTLDGRRRWRNGVDFVYHLGQTMKSIAHSWLKGKKPLSQLSEDSLPPEGSAEQQAKSGQEWLRPRNPDPQSTLRTRETLKAIRTAFSDDTEVSEIIEGWAMGLKGPEIQNLTGMSNKAYQAAVRRLRYQAGRIESDHGV